MDFQNDKHPPLRPEETAGTYLPNRNGQVYRHQVPPVNSTDSAYFARQRTDAYQDSLAEEAGTTTYYVPMTREQAEAYALTKAAHSGRRQTDFAQTDNYFTPEPVPEPEIIKPTYRRPLISTLYSTNSREEREADEYTSDYAEDDSAGGAYDSYNYPQNSYNYRETPAYPEDPEYENEARNTRRAMLKAAQKQRHKRKSFAGIVVLVVFVFALISLYRFLLPKSRNSNTTFSVFNPKVKVTTKLSNLKMPATSGNISKDTKNTEITAADTQAAGNKNGITDLPPQAAASAAISRGGEETYAGGVKLSADQAQRMINLSLQSSKENMEHNLDILQEADQRVAELREAQGQLPPNMLLLAAKNEAFDFVYNYLSLKDDSPQKRLDLPSKPGSSSLGSYLLPYGKVLPVPYYCQWDARWGYKPYGGSVIGTYGCGVTCMASVLSYFKHDAKLLPDVVAQLSIDMNTVHDGTDTAFITQAAEKFNLRAEGTPILYDNFRRIIDAGNLIVLNVGKGNFTAGGHYISIVGYNDNGDFIVYDPVSPYHTSQVWPISLLQRQNSRACWSISRL